MKKLAYRAFYFTSYLLIFALIIPVSIIQLILSPLKKGNNTEWIYYWISHFVRRLVWPLLMIGMRSSLNADDTGINIFITYRDFRNNVKISRTTEVESKNITLAEWSDIVCDIPSALITSNHISESDGFILNMLLNCAGRLCDIRYLVKCSIAWIIPFVGIHFLLAGFIGMKRNKQWKDDKKALEAALQSYIENCDRNIFLVIFPEGTRLNRIKLIEAQDYARKEGLPVFNHVLQPKYRGFTAILEVFKGCSQMNDLIDVTLAGIDQSGKLYRAPEIFEIITSDMGHYNIYLNIDRFSMNQVRNFEAENFIGDEEGHARNWLLWRFEKKEEILRNVYLQK